MKKLFGGLNMSWRNVIIFATLAGAYTGAVMLPGILKNTSFQDIGSTYEWWVIFAVIIVTSCGRSTEAMLKCFAFFLISQPIVFAVEVLFGTLTPDMAIYYYRSIWLPITFLTLPGGFIAYYCKKERALGAFVLGLGNTIQAVLGLSYLLKAASDFPHHLLTVIVCFGSIFVMTWAIQSERKNRAIALAVPLIAAAGIALLLKASGRVL